jgi:hypothetical protein
LSVAFFLENQEEEEEQQQEEEEEEEEEQQQQQQNTIDLDTIYPQQTTQMAIANDRARMLPDMAEDLVFLHDSWDLFKEYHSHQ